MFSIALDTSSTDNALLLQLSNELTSRSGIVTHVLHQTDSTNTQLLDTPQTEHSHEPRALIALSQTAGRGRRGRAWEQNTTAAAHPAFLGSMAAATTLNPATLSTLPLHIGVAVAETLRQWGCTAQIKWPNDLLIGGKKLGGILVETRGFGHNNTHQSTLATTWVVMGLGLNWHSAPSLPDRATACVVDNTTKLPDEITAAAALVGAIHTAWQRVHHSATLHFSAYDALLGQAVMTDTGLEGVACGVNAAGQLGLRSAASGAVTWIHSGEVSVKVSVKIDG